MKITKNLKYTIRILNTEKSAPTNKSVDVKCLYMEIHLFSKGKASLLKAIN